MPPGRGRKPADGPEIKALIIERTLRSCPTQATQWSVRSVAKALDLSFSTVGVGLAMNDLFVARGRDGLPLQEAEAQDAHFVLGL